jgi:hypothetical protein
VKPANLQNPGFRWAKASAVQRLIRDVVPKFKSIFRRCKLMIGRGRPRIPAL